MILAGLMRRRFGRLVLIQPNYRCAASRFLFNPSKGSTRQLLSGEAEPNRNEFPVENAYNILNVSETSSFADIKASFCRLAKETHPDLVESKKDPSNSIRFVQILAAYEILSDSEKRAHYDRYLLSRRMVMPKHSRQGYVLHKYKTRLTLSQEMEEVVEWLKWYREAIHDIVLEKRVANGTCYLDELEEDFYSAIRAAYFGPDVESVELLPDYFEAEERWQDRLQGKDPSYQSRQEQIVSASIAGDIVKASAYVHELPHCGLTVGLTNYAAAYCIGLLLARRVLKILEMDDEYEGNVEATGEDFSVEPTESRRPFHALLDVGLIRTTTGNRVFGALKGALDDGLDIPHSDKRFASFNKENKQQRELHLWWPRLKLHEAVGRR